jgi:hypothetical protein
LTPDQALLDAGLADLSAKLDVYEVILGKHKFLAGDVRIVSFPPRGPTLLVCYSVLADANFVW